MTPRTTFLRALLLDSPCSSDEADPTSERSVAQRARRSAGSASAACGRPFLVQGAARLAPVAWDSDWPTQVAAVMFPRDERLREALVDHYAALGLMEHASIAAFARFTLQLLSLGAPAELVGDAYRAQSDEAKHARICFGLASAYARCPMGPGPLRLDLALEDCSWEAIFEATVLEGCIGETRAALEATWAAERCIDPVVRSILDEISDDEARHAALAWRAVNWMLQRRPELLGLVPRLFGSTERMRPRAALRPWGARPWGVLNDEELTECWDDAWVEVITPCARSLLKAHARAATEENRRSA